MKQLIDRLFPFKRGLLHAYWAGNIWALYSFMDKVLRVLLGHGVSSVNSSALGIVQETNFDLLPSIPTFLTIGLIIIFTVPLSVSIWRNPRKSYFPYYLSFAIFTFFMFGYHVHEKAILMVIIVYHATSFNDAQSLYISTLLRITTGISMFPLLFQINGNFVVTLESPIKYILLAIDLIVFEWTTLDSKLEYKEKQRTITILKMGFIAAMLLGSLYVVNAVLLK